MIFLDISRINHQINSGEFSSKPCLTTPELLASDVFFLGKASLRYHRWFAGNNCPQEIIGECSHLKTRIYIYICNTCIYIYNTCIYIYIEYGCISNLQSNLQCCLMQTKTCMMVRNPCKKSWSSWGAVWKSWKLMSGSGHQILKFFFDLEMQRQRICWKSMKK